MNRFSIFIGALFFASTGFAQEKTDQAKTQFKDEKEKISYAVGLGEGLNFLKQNDELKKMDSALNADAFLKGLKDGMDGKPQLSPEQVREALSKFQSQVMERQERMTKDAGSKNAAEGEKFLAENKKKPDVKTTASGLQYKVIKEGTGSMPKATDTVTVNYRGTLLDGTEFDSSYKRGQPASFPLNRVIPGWTEALQLMKVGSKYQLFVPASLAYADRRDQQGNYGPGGPNATLIFEVELLNIQASPSGSASASPGAAASASPSSSPK